MNASKDENSISSLITALNTDGKTIQTIAVNPVNHAMKINLGTTGIDYGPEHALRDDNFVPTLIGVSSADFKTPTVVYGDANHELLIDNT